MADLVLVIGNKNYSSWSLRPWLALRHYNIPFEEIRIPLDTSETPDLIRQYSPSGKVPVLLHEGLIVWESLAICEYVAELFPEHLWYPTDLRARAIARAISHEMHSGFSQLRSHMPLDVRSRYPGQGRNPGVQQDINRILEIWHTCRQQYGSGGDFLMGHFTLADAMYAPVISRFVTYGVELDAIAQNYASAVWNLPAMQEWIAAATIETEVLENS